MLPRQLLQPQPHPRQQKRQIIQNRQAQTAKSSSSSSSSLTILSTTIILFVLFILALQLYLLWSHHGGGIIGSSNIATGQNSISQSSSASLLDSIIGGTTFSPVYPWDGPGAELLYRLPVWIQTYVKWHQEMRRAFPGKLLFEHPDAPPVLIRTCLGLCGGLNDRLGQLPWDLYLANQTKRVLLIHWHRPVPLESFFQPQLNLKWRSEDIGNMDLNEDPNLPKFSEYALDWRVPPDVAGFFPPPASLEQRVSREGMRIVRNAYPDLFEGYASERPEDDFWNEHLDLTIQRATIGTFSKHHVLRHRLLGHLNEQVLEQRLRALGETDLLHSTPSFGRIFHLFFRPAPAVQAEITTVMKDLLQSSSYTSGAKPLPFSAVHCRVRHPKATAGLVKGKNENYPADKSGLPWYGETRAFAIATAIHALRCAPSIIVPAGAGRAAFAEEAPIYFFSDSNDLVRFMTRELLDPEYISANRGALSPSNHSSIDAQALQVVKSIPRLVARNPETENAHIDRQKGRDAPAYFGSFVDLYVAMAARCVTYGIGWYAVFAAKVSATDCTMLYQEEAWGGTDTKQLHSTQQCKLSPPAILHKTD